MRTLVIVGLVAGAVAALRPTRAPGSWAWSSMGLAGGPGARLRIVCSVIALTADWRPCSPLSEIARVSPNRTYD